MKHFDEATRAKLVAMTQKERVQWHFENFGGTLDTVEAGRMYSIGRLPNRICELNDLGFVFKKSWAKYKSLLGKPYEVRRYELIQKGVA